MRSRIEVPNDIILQELPEDLISEIIKRIDIKGFLSLYVTSKTLNQIIKKKFISPAHMLKLCEFIDENNREQHDLDSRNDVEFKVLNKGRSRGLLGAALIATILVVLICVDYRDKSNQQAVTGYHWIADRNMDLIGQLSQLEKLQQDFSDLDSRYPIITILMNKLKKEKQLIRHYLGHPGELQSAFYQEAHFIIAIVAVLFVILWNLTECSLVRIGQSIPDATKNRIHSLCAQFPLS